MNANQSLDRVNYLNIFLVLISAGMAYAYPFELFLLVYAVLGPLHYLTEISWLQGKQFYTRRKYDYLFLSAAGLAITGIFLWPVPGLPREAEGLLVYMAFAAAGAFLWTGNIPRRVLALSLALLAGLGMARYPFFGPLFGLFFPTLIHVFVFTGFFLLGGALKSRSATGFASLGVFLAAACGFILFHPAHGGYHPGNYIRNNYGFFGENGVGNSVFISLNYMLVQTLGVHSFGPPARPLADYVKGINDYLYQSPAALALMSFIAFSYTYHYLNWFSKTAVIRWHEVSRGKMTLVVLIWTASLVLYGWNYSVGFKWLFFLSFAHVLLEFPLDHLTILNISKDLGRIFGGGRRTAEAQGKG